MSFVQLKFGDMFDGPCDLIVLPCSTSGTITSFVRRQLKHHRIPYPAAGMKLGDLSIAPFEGGENISQFVAYAASVEGRVSSFDAIRRIGELLGTATIERNAIRRVSVPLLGSGAGGLDASLVIKELSSGFKATAHHDATMVIHILQKEIFDRLKPSTPTVGEQASIGQRSDSAIRVFVSYSRTSPEHERWVEKLATFLRANGIDARLDSWHLRHGMDLPQWMTNEITLAERVLLISDEKYAEKADGRVGGVGWETMIVQGDISRQPPESTKYLVIVTSEKVDDGLPIFLRTKFVIHWPGKSHDGQNQQILLQELFNVVKVPPIGCKPVFL